MSPPAAPRVADPMPSRASSTGELHCSASPPTKVVDSPPIDLPLACPHNRENSKEDSTRMKRHPIQVLALTAAGAAVSLWTQATTGAPPAALVLRSFDRVLNLEEKGETSASVSIGDLNGDGFPDIVLAKGRHWPLFNRILLNDGKGDFKGSNLGDAADRTYSAALADIDGDGRLDIVVSNDRPDNKLVYRNEGGGHFRATETFGDPGWSTRYVTLADLNGDGFPDIIVANRNGGAKKAAQPSFVCWNNGKGAFPSCTPLPTESATIIVAADFDGDGAIDLFVPHRDGGRGVILWNDGKGTFTKSTPFGPPVSNTRAAAAGDVNGDGRPDIVIGGEEGGVSLYVNVGNRSFSEPIPLSTAKQGTYSVVIADLNRDGKKDIVVGYVEAPGSVFYNTGSPKDFREVHWNDGKGSVYGMAVGDLDGDGWPDIVTARTDAPNAVWFSTPYAAAKGK